MLFLKKQEKPININSLQKEVWGHKSKLETHTVETHIYRLRKKIGKKTKVDTKIIILPILPTMKLSPFNQPRDERP